MTEYLHTYYKNNFKIYISELKHGDAKESIDIKLKLKSKVKEEVYLVKAGDAVALNRQILLYEIAEILWNIYRMKK